MHPGVDLVVYGRERQVEWDFVVRPGADPEAVRFSIDGADRVELDSTGELVLEVDGGEVRLLRPQTYQERGGKRQEVASAYRLLPSDGQPGRRVAFELGAYDLTRPLVIDPVLVYSTYLGGRSEDSPYAIAVDAKGNAYVTGFTDVPPTFPDVSNFPVTPGSLKTESVSPDAFITKLDPSGAIVYSTYLGGDSADDSGTGIAVDARGNAYVAGYTASFDFPLVHPL